MPKLIIERNIPGAGKLSREEPTALSKKSCDVLGELGPQVQWRESYVTDDTICGLARGAHVAGHSEPVLSSVAALLGRHGMDVQ